MWKNIHRFVATSATFWAAVSPDDVTAAVAAPNRDGSRALVAITWYVPGVAGAVKRPAASMLPPPASRTDQVTAVGRAAVAAAVLDDVPGTAVLPHAVSPAAARRASIPAALPRVAVFKLSSLPPGPVGNTLLSQMGRSQASHVLGRPIVGAHQG
jgi:hypothetical protein